jgi:Tfp pilus assembly protein PilO
MKLSPNNELIVAGVVIAVLAAAFIGLLIVPQYFAMGEKDRQSAQATQDIQAAQNLLDQRQSVKAQAAGTQAELMRLQNEIPDTPELPTLIIGLQDIANASGLDFTKITPANPAPLSGYTAIPVEVVLQGSWTDVIDYLHRLQGLERKVRVTGLAVKVALPDATAGTQTSSTQQATYSGKLEADIKLEAYVIGAVAAPASSSATSSAPATASP